MTLVIFFPAGDTYVIAIYFVETVVSDSFLDSTPEYRRLKDREETQVMTLQSC